MKKMIIILIIVIVSLLVFMYFINNNSVDIQKRDNTKYEQDIEGIKDEEKKEDNNSDDKSIRDTLDKFKDVYGIIQSETE